MSEFVLQQGHSFKTMLAVAAVAIVLSAIFYRRAFGMLRRIEWQTLLLLRIIGIVLIVVLLFRPEYRYYKTEEQRPSVVFLLDRSQSMSVADGESGATRFSRARERVNDWWQQLSGDFDLHLIQFADEAAPLEDVSQLATLAPDGRATSLAAPFRAAAGVVEPKDLEAVFLLSDGIHNLTGDPPQVAKQLAAAANRNRKKDQKLGVYVVGVGASLRSDTSYRDIHVVDLECPDRMMMNNAHEIVASVDAVGMGSRVVNVVLEDEGETIDEKELTLDDLEGPQTVTFEVRPASKGRHVYTVRVPPSPEEKIEENNERSAASIVYEPGIHVLYIEGTLRAEYGALVQRFLSKDPDVLFCALVRVRGNRFNSRSNIPDFKLDGLPTGQESVNRFDVFILGDLDATYISPQQQEFIIERIRQGAGLVMLGGYHSLGPGGWRGTPLGDVLPVELGGTDIGQMTDPLLPILTPDGRAHPIFANIGGFFPTEEAEPAIGGLPPLEGCTRVEAARPGATVLANCRTETGTMPVLAVQRLGKGWTAVFTGDTTRSWQQGPRAMGQKSPFIQFWGQMVRWLAGRSEDVVAEAGVEAELDKAYYDPGERFTITAIVRDERGEGTNDARVTARIRDEAGKPFQVTLPKADDEPAGHYRDTFLPETPGEFQIVVEAKLGEQTLKTDAMVVEVGQPKMEFDRLDLDEKMLRQIAASAGGTYAHISAADALLERLDRRLRERREAVVVKLYWPPGFWLVFVLVLTAEWVLRKRFQLR